MGEVVRSDQTGRKWLAAVAALFGCLAILGAQSASAEAAPAGAADASAIVAKPDLSLRKQVKCPMGGGYVLINLKKMRCKPALKIHQKWYAKFRAKPKRVIRVRKFTCRWNSKLNIYAVGRLTCHKRGKKVPRFSLRRP